MELSEFSDSKDSTTVNHGAGTSKIMDHVESNPTISNHDQASSTGNFQVMIDQPRHGNVDEQQQQIEDANEQQSGSDALMNPCSSQQAQPNQIANVVQQHQQLLLNDLNPRLPMNERQQNGLFDQPQQAMPPINSTRENAMSPDPFERKLYPHFHLMLGVQDWVYTDNHREVIRERQWPPMDEFQQPLARERQQIIRHRPIIINECHRLPMPLYRMTDEKMQNMRINPPINMRGQRPKNIPDQEPNNMSNEQPQVIPNYPPLLVRREVEPGIFKEIYAHKRIRIDMAQVIGVDRCVCQEYLDYNYGNNGMITVIMNTPDVTERFSMTIDQDLRFDYLFNAYLGLTNETANTIFVANGKRLSGEDTPKLVGLEDNEIIYAYVNFNEYDTKKLDY